LLQLIKLLSLRIRGFLVDTVKVATSKERLRQLFHVPLYSNAIYLMIASAVGAVLGFVFWIVAARFYTPEDVGLASAAISAAGLMAMIATLGLGYGLIRLLSQSGKKANDMLNSCFTIGTLSSVVAGLIFLVGLGFWSPALLFVQQSPIFFIAFIILTASFTLTYLAGDTFVAERQAGFTLAITLVHGLLKLPLVILLALAFHAFGIFVSWTISLFLASLLGIFLFLPRVRTGYRPRFTINRGVIGEMVHFASANYAANFVSAAPGFVLPIIIVNLLGAEANAYFYIAWMIGSLLLGVSGAVSLSLFAEGSYDEGRLGVALRRSLKLTFLILVPAVMLILAFADKLLILFGAAYSQSGTVLLRILAISAIPSAINLIYLGMKRVEKKLTIIIALTSFIAAGTLVLSYVLLPYLGINGVGIAFLSSHGITALVIVAGWLKGRVGSQKGQSFTRQK
jgi:O-antigen/teichoic acid export membrane protein